MHMLEEDLCYMLDDQIGHAIQKGDISPSEMDTIYKAVKTKYYIKVMKAMEEYDDRGYSGKRMVISYDGHPYYDNEYSYSRNNRNSMGRFTSRDGYSGDGKEEMRRYLEMALNAATTDSERQNLRNMLDSMM